MNNKPKSLYACVILAMLLPTVGALFYFVILGESPAAKIAYGITKLFTLAWPLLVYFLLEKRMATDISLGSIKAYENTSPWKKHLASLPLGLLTGLLIVGIMFTCYKYTPLGDYVRQCGELVREKTESLGLVEHFWIMAIFISLAHSLLEEYYWRWFIYGRLRHLCPPAIAGILASAAFAGHHYIVLSVWFPLWLTILLGTAVGIGGGLWCWMYQRQKSLLGIWLSHALVDAGIMIIGHELIMS